MSRINQHTAPQSVEAQWLQKEEQQFDLRLFFFRYILQYWYLYVIGLVIAVSIAYLQLRYTTPIYQVQSKLLIKESEKGSLSEEAVLEDLGFFQGDRNLENEIEILRSRSLMHQTVEELGLSISYMSEGRIRTTESYPHGEFFIDTFSIPKTTIGRSFQLRDIDGTRFEWIIGEEKKLQYPYGQVFVNQYGTFRVLRKNNLAKDYPQYVRFVDTKNVGASYAGGLRITPIGGSSVLQLSLKDVVPNKAIDILDKLVEVYNREAKEDKNEAGLNTLQFIDERLGYYTTELSDVEKDIEKYKDEYSITTGVLSDAMVVMPEIRELETQLLELEKDQELIASLSKYINENEGTYIPAFIPEEYVNISQQIKDYNDLIAQEDNFLLNATEINPRYAGYKQQIDNTYKGISQSTNEALNGIRQNKRKIERKRSSLLAKVNSVPIRERELLEIQRQQGIKEQLYLYLLQKREETGISLAVTPANSRVIDPARRSSSMPVSPNKGTSYMLAILLGLGIPAGLAALRESLDTKVRSEEDIKKQTQVPILGGVSQIGKTDQIVVGSSRRTAIAEMFRLLRTNLMYMRAKDDQVQSTLVTSSTSGEGKTFISINLAVSIAISGKKTVVIGLDMRKPQFQAYFKDNYPSIGLSTYLIGQAEMEEIIIPSNIHENLYFVPSGSIPPNPSELIMNEQLEKLFSHLQENFDNIIIDSPPVGLVADALLLAKFASHSLYIVAADKTKKPMLHIIEDIYQGNKLPSPSIVMNGVGKKGKYGYGYGYGKSYGSGYGYGYYEGEG